MSLSVAVDTLRLIFIKYGGIPADEAVALVADLDELREEVVEISNTEIINLAATPKTLVAAPGAGKILILHDITLRLNYAGTNIFAVGAGDDFQVKYVDASGLAASASIETAAWLIAALDGYANYKGTNIADGTLAQLANVPLVLDNTGVEVTGNAGLDNTITATVRYSILDA